MSILSPIDHQRTKCDQTNRVAEANREPTLLGALPFLLQLDPEAIIAVELVDQPLELPEDQFESLLIDSECEV